jgi:restriction system protein
MIFSTAGFQEGAVQYAELHGIALVQIARGETTYFSRSKKIAQTAARLATDSEICWLVDTWKTHERFIAHQRRLHS